MLEKLTKAKPGELQLWMWSAGILGFGLGAYLANYVGPYAVWIIVLSLIVHLIIMYRIYTRK